VKVVSISVHSVPSAVLARKITTEYTEKKLKGNSVVPVRKTTTEYTEASVFLSEHSVVLARKITTEYTEKH
jgi:hypothetical protein